MKPNNLLRIKNGLSRARTDTIYRNSLFLIISSLFSAFFGFIFWKVMSLFYSEATIGRSSSLLTLSAFVALISSIGLDEGLKRFLPEKGSDKTRLINFVLFPTIVVSVIISSLTFVILTTISSEYRFFQQTFSPIIIFTLIVAGTNVLLLLQAIFIATKKSVIVLGKSIAFGLLKFPIPLLLVLFPFFLPEIRILSGYAVGSWIMICILFLLVPVIIKDFSINFEFEKKSFAKMLNYSIGNYFASFISSWPVPVLSILIVELISAEVQAYFFIGRMLAGFLYIIPFAASTVFLVESVSKPQKIQKNLWKSLGVFFILILPSASFLFIFGNIALGTFGFNYAVGGIDYLRIMVISVVPLTIVEFYKSFCRYKNDVRKIIIINSIISFSFFFASIFLISDFGIAGIGIGWLISQCVVLVPIIFELGYWIFTKRNKNIEISPYD